MMQPIAGFRLSNVGGLVSGAPAQNAENDAELAYDAARNKANIWMAKKNAESIRRSGREEARGIVEGSIFKSIGSIASGIGSSLRKPSVGGTRTGSSAARGGFNWGVVDKINPYYEG